MAIEIDGPPMAYFEAGGREQYYETALITGLNPAEVVAKAAKVVAALHDELGPEGAIVWRKRPVCESEDVVFVVRFRFVTIPELKGGRWRELMK